MEQVLSSFSDHVAGLVERAGQSAVGIEARHRMGSSGFLWKPGVIVTVLCDGAYKYLSEPFWHD